MAAKDGAALRKRAQIAKANRMMFLWVAVVSAVVGVAVVGSIFLIQKLAFNERVLAGKRETVSALRHNLESVEALKGEVRALESNQALISSRPNGDADALQAILDALPSDANSLAFGASIQDRLLSGVSGLSLESLQVDPVAGVESVDGEAGDVSASEDAAEGEEGEGSEFTNVIGFRMVVVGGDDSLRELLRRFERSIRTIDVTSLTLEARGNQQALSIEGRGFYEPARTLELKDRTIQP